MNNFEANNKPRVRGQYIPLNTNFNETSPLAKISDDSHPQLCQLIISRHVGESKTVLDSGFHAVDSGFQVLGFRFFVRGTWFPHSLSCINSRFTATASFMAYLPLPHEQEKLQRLQIASARPYCYRKKKSAHITPV